MKYGLFALLLILASCNSEPFVKHEVSFKKIADGCDNMPRPFRMVSNIGGERFEFTECLSADFDKTKMNVTREGDTVNIQFPNGNGNKAMFELTVDIDSYPKYNYLTVGSMTYQIKTSN